MTTDYPSSGRVVILGGGTASGPTAAHLLPTKPPFPRCR